MQSIIILKLLKAIRIFWYNSNKANVYFFIFLRINWKKIKITGIFPPTFWIDLLIGKKMILKRQLKECNMEFLNGALMYLHINMKGADSAPYTQLPILIRMKLSMCHIPAMWQVIRLAHLKVLFAGKENHWRWIYVTVPPPKRVYRNGEIHLCPFFSVFVSVFHISNH